jgi:prephenate dehydrogenase
MNDKDKHSPFRTVAIIGVGVIGGSLGLSIKRKFPTVRVTGVSSRKTLDEALSIRAIDAGFERDRLSEGVAGADLIFLCAPISVIMELLPVIASAAPEGSVVTDVGSTKTAIMDRASACFGNGRYFVGGHPMAGNEGRGVAWADALLFENAVWVLTPSTSVPSERFNGLAGLIQTLGAHVLVLDPALHDRIAATVSHLPQMLAVTLMNLVANQDEPEPYLKLAAGGFRDMTRIASSPYAIWKDIFSTNRDLVSRLLDDFIAELELNRDRLAREELEDQFARSGRNRLAIPKDTKGFLRAHYDLSVPVEDRPGVIAAIAVALAGEKINIKDIEIVKVREGDAGTLRLSFESESERSRALTVLEGIDLRPRIRS